MNSSHKPKQSGRSHMNNIVLCIFVAMIIFAPITASASSVHGHLFFASKMLIGPAKIYLADDPQLTNLYMLGAVGPDSFWVARLSSVPEVREKLKKTYKVILPGRDETLRSLIKDVHRTTPIRVTLSLLPNAQTSEESAYALGWVTHFITDAHIHNLVNRWKGYSDKDFDLNDPFIATHNKLEALEARHILTKYSKDLIIKYFPERELQSSGSYDERFMHSAYPDDHNFQPPRVASFIFLLHEAEILMSDSSRWFYYQATHSPREIGRMKVLLKRFKPKEGRLIELVTDLPDRKQYLSEMSSSSFIQEWEKAKEEVLVSGRDIIPLCVTYLWLHQHQKAGEPDDPVLTDLLSRIGSELLRIAPDDDLIKPTPF